MDYKKIQADYLAKTRDVKALEAKADNVYEMIMVIAKRANQISLDIKEELQNKIKEVSSSIDNLEEIFENREQIELAKFYETLPKPTLMALQEYKDDQVYFRTNKDEEV